MMILYKGSYSPAHQYLPNKPCKWDIKVLCITDSTTKYVYNFEIYCGRNDDAIGGGAPLVVGEGGLAQEVVLRLVSGLEGKGHVVKTDNYFSSVPLFLELAN
jgi:hypothetical protein